MHEIPAILDLALGSRLVQFEKSTGHIIIEVIVVPECYEEAESTEKHSLHTTDVWEEVKECIAVSSDDKLVDIDFKGHI